MPKVTVLYFARCREITEISEEKVEFPDFVTEEQILVHLEALHPGIGGMKGRLTVAHNQSYMTAGVKLSENDEIALIPPVSGG